MNTSEYLEYPTALESVITLYDDMIIDWMLFTLAPSVHVVGHRQLEDGLELVVEGEAGQVAELIYVLGQGVK